MTPGGVISTIVCVGFCAICIIILFIEVPTGSKEIANVVFGVLGTAFITVVNYYLGTSRSSASKDQTIQELAKK